MGNQSIGILTVLICTVGYFYSWRLSVKRRQNFALFLLVLTSFVLRFYLSSDFYLHNWDERFHALVAKNLINHPLMPTLYDNPVLPYNPVDWTANHIWLHKQPVPLWTMAASMWIFGVNEIALRLPSILISSIAVLLTYQVGTYFFEKKTGFFAAFLFSINGLILELTAGRIPTDHIDVFFLFFILLAIFCSIIYIKKKNSLYNILAGLSLGFAILTKWLPALIVLPIWLLLVIESGKFNRQTIVRQFILLVGVSILAFLPWQIFIFYQYPIEAGIESAYNFTRITTAIEGRSGSIFSHLDWIRITYHDLIYLPLIWFGWKIYKNPKDLKLVALGIWFLIPFLFFSIVKTKMQAYLLFTAPALFIMVAGFYYWLNEIKKNYKLKWLIAIILLLLVALPIRYSIERIKPLSDFDRSPGWVIDLKKLNDREIEKGILFNYPKPIEAMFYTDLTVYPSLPDKEFINNLILDGYTVIINDSDQIPPEIKEIENVHFENLRSKN